MKYLLMLLFVTTFFIATACEQDDCSVTTDCESNEVCVSGECVKEAMKPTLEFLSLKDGDSLFGTHDEDLTTDGIQYTVTAKAMGIEADKMVVLDIEQDGATTISKSTTLVEKDSNLVAVFDKVDFSTFDGKVKLTLKVEDVTYKVITINVKGVYGISITSPENNKTLTEDKDLNKYYFQSDILVEVTGLRDSTQTLVNLDLFKGDVKESTYSKFSVNGSVLFTNVDFKGGEYKLIASFKDSSDNLVESAPIMVTTPAPDACEVTILPETETKIDIAYLKSNNILDKRVPLVAKSNCPAGFKVSYLINEGTDDEETVESTLTDVDGEILSVVYYQFPEDEDRDNLPSTLKVFVAKDLPDNNAGFSEALYYVDTIAPQLSLTATKTELTELDDTVAAERGVQFPITVNMDKMADGQTLIIESNRGGSWTELTSFVKDSESKEVVLTLESGTYALRARGMDVHDQEGISDLLSITVTVSDCSITEVKMNETILATDATNTITNEFMDNGNVNFMVTASLACNGNNLLVKKDDLVVATILLDSEDGLKEASIPFTNGENINLTFEVETTPATVTYPINVVLSSADLSRVTPVDMDLTYVNANNNTDGYIKDLDNATDGAQISLTINVKDIMGGSVEMIASAVGDEDLSLGTQDVTSNDMDLTFNVTLPESKEYTLKFKAMDINNFETLVTLYNANVDVINPGNLDTALVTGNMANLKIDLSWNQANSGDDLDSGNIAKYVVKYTEGVSFTEAQFDTLEENSNTYIIVIDNPSMNSDEFSVLLDANYDSDYFIGVKAYDDLGNASELLTVTANDLFDTTSKNVNTASYDSNSGITGMRSVGDLNGDGNEDFVVAQAYSGYNGKVFIYYGTGGQTLGIPQMISGGAEDALGSCISSGDFNGDGIQDLMLGAAWSGKYGSNYPGAVKIYYGGVAGIETDNVTVINNSYLNTETNLKTKGWHSDGDFGVSCDFVGDINNDGKDDIIIGQDLSADGGRAFILAGRSGGGDITIDQTNIDSNTVMLSHDFIASGARFGFQVKNLGDMNKDGVNDVAVTALRDNYTDDSTNDDGQKISIFYLNRNIFSQTEIISKSDNSGGAVVCINTDINFGRNIDVGDLDGDGNLDLVVGALGTGGISLYYGDGTELEGTETPINIRNPGGLDNFNNDLKVGDYNNDGKDDLLVSAQNILSIYLGEYTHFTNLSKPNTSLSWEDLGFSGVGFLKATLSQLDGDNNDTIICNATTKECVVKFR